MFIKYLYKKGFTRLAAASDKVYQLLAHGRWFSPGTPASSTTKTGHHDIAESGVKTPKIKSNQIKIIRSRVTMMMLSATFNNMSVISWGIIRKRMIMMGSYHTSSLIILSCFILLTELTLWSRNRTLSAVYGKMP